MNHLIELENRYCAHNYKPLPVVLTKGQGAYVWDDSGKKYLDMMSAYSAVSFGHCHPRLVKALYDQASTLDVISRAFYSDKLGVFLERICGLTGLDKALPMNTGAEAVETAIKIARKWAYTVKKVPENQAEIIVCQNNFHGRTTTLVSMSSEPQYRHGFGPLTPGFKMIPYGNAAVLKQNITANTAAFLVEPIQGEAGIVIPPAGYLKQCETICRDNNVLFLCDEIQTGLGRTGKLLACEHDDVKPDGVTLGKALGGGLLPVSIFLARKELMDVLTPGDHGSTFGGNPISAAVGLAALDVLMEENLIARSAELGAYFLAELNNIKSPLITQIRGRGLFIGIDVDAEKMPARDVCLKLMALGLLTKDTHQTTLRLAPPLIINKDQIDAALTIIRQAFVE